MTQKVNVTFSTASLGPDSDVFTITGSGPKLLLRNDFEANHRADLQSRNFGQPNAHTLAVAEAKNNPEEHMRKQKGFSLIELLIVVAIILIIAAIAIPNLLRARMSANESSAAAGVRTIATAQVTYNTTYQNGYADTLVKLGTPAAGCTTPDASTGACLIDNVLTAATTTTTPKSGYVFGVSFGSSADKNTFVAGAFPAKFNSTGLRSFCTTEDNVVHQNSASQTAIPSATDCISATWPALNN